MADQREALPCAHVYHHHCLVEWRAIAGKGETECPQMCHRSVERLRTAERQTSHVFLELRSMKSVTFPLIGQKRWHNLYSQRICLLRQ